VKQKLDELIQLYDDIKASTQERSLALEDTFDVAEKFWEDLNTLMGTVKVLQDGLKSQDPPSLEPAIIREQQDYLETIKEEIEESKADLDDVKQTGEQLMSLCGEPEQPEVKKNIDDAETNMNEIESHCEKRSKSLEAALQKAVHFQDELMVCRILLKYGLIVR